MSSDDVHEGSRVPESLRPGPMSGPVSGRPVQRKRSKVLVRMASIGASAQAAIPGLYA